MMNSYKRRYMNSLLDIETLRRAAKEILPSYQRNWLTKAVEILRQDFEQIGETFSEKIHIQVDYPCVDVGHSWMGSYFLQVFPEMDDLPELTRHWIYINPTVNGLDALSILVHELVHASVGMEGHEDHFLKVASAIGLDDSGPSAIAEEILLKRLENIQGMLGSYPLVFDCLEKS